MKSLVPYILAHNFCRKRLTSGMNFVTAVFLAGQLKAKGLDLHLTMSLNVSAKRHVLNESRPNKMDVLSQT